MPQAFTYGELDALPPNSPGFAGMAQQARAAVCGAYHRYPGAFSPLIADSPYAQFQQALWDKVCPIPERPPTMPVPQPLPAGGQCPIRYRVEGTFQTPRNPNAPNPRSFSNIVLGPVQGIVQDSIPGSLGWWVQGRPGSPGEDGRSFIFSNASGPSSVGAYARITSITPLDSIPPGGCDTIPSPRNYEPLRPDNLAFVLPPAGSLVPGPGAPLGPPTVVRPMPRLPRLPLPLPFGPFVQVDLGPFNFQFDLGGLQFNLKPDIDINLAPNVDIDINLPSGGSSGGGRTVIELPEDCGCSDQFKDLRDKIESTRPKFTSATTTQLAANSSGGNATLPPGHVSVRFVVTQKPVNSNEMFGSGGPDVYFPGWYSFSRGLGTGGTRQPIDYLENFVFSPIESTHVSWTAKTGYRFDVFAVSRNPPSSGTWARGSQLYWQV
jgi:hypothetical protein